MGVEIWDCDHGREDHEKDVVEDGGEAETRNE